MHSGQFVEQEEIRRKQEKLFDQQKKFKNLEADKKLFAEETINAIKKQKMAIDKLRKENEALKQLIAKVNNDKSQQGKPGQDPESAKQFAAEIRAAIQEEKETQQNIDLHIANFQKKIVEKKKNCLGNNSGPQNESNLQKQIKILENRLDKANQKYNETISVNKDLKHVIDSLRKERVIFDNLYKKLESELHEKRKRMANIIEKANNAYEDRDKANHQITTMKQLAKKEAGEFQKEIKEMSYLVQKIKLANYMKKEARNSGSEKAELPTYSADATEIKMVKQTKKSSEQVEKIHKYRQDFAKIEAATEIDNFDELLRIFSRNEEKNFQMFKFVNLQSNEIEELEVEVANLREEIEKGAELAEVNDKEKYLQQMETELKQLRIALNKVETEYKASQKEAKALSSLIERIFDSIECDREIAKEIAGSKSISQMNLLVFLAIIGHKSIQIASVYRQLSNDNMLSTQPIKPTVLPQGVLTFEDFEDNEEYDKILTAEELRKKAYDFISKQQNQKQKKKDFRPKKK